MTSSDYQPSALLLQQISGEQSVPLPAQDISNIIRIIVHASVLNNNISLLSAGTDTTICNRQDPNYLKGQLPTGGTVFMHINGYLPLIILHLIRFLLPVPELIIIHRPLTVTTYYKRQVISGACTVVSAATIKVTVLQVITNNIISAGQTICINSIPSQLTGANLTGGDGNYRFSWEQSSNNGVNWVPAAGTNNASSGIISLLL